MNRRIESASPLALLIIASILWGASYGLVGLLHDTNPALITGGRFVLYGLMSAVLLTWSRGWRAMHWRAAFFQAATGYVALYLAEVIAIQLAGPAPTIAVLGSIPVIYAWIGAQRDGFDRRRLLPAIGLMGLSHLFIHAAGFSTGDRSWYELIAGIAIAGVGVASWIAYALHNTRFMRTTDIAATQWSSAVGVAAAVWSMPLLIIGVRAGVPAEVGPLIAVVVFLAIGPSWVAAAVWNRGSKAMPRTTAGQMLVFEPLSAFAIVHLLTWTVPTGWQLVGEVLLLVGALWAVRITQQMSVSVNSNVADKTVRSERIETGSIRPSSAS